MWKSDQIAAGCQGAAFCVSILLIGFVWGHEKVIRYLVVREPDYDKKKAPWQQECYKVAKAKARTFFPLYWYWGNVRAALMFWLLAILYSTDPDVVGAPELSAGIIVLVNVILFFSSRQTRWEKVDQ